MNIQAIAEHSFDVDLLQDRANILDLGCRGFEFADHFTALGHHVITVDADPQIFAGPKHHSVAITGSGDGSSAVPFKIEKDKQASYVAPGENTGLWVKEYSLQSFSKMVGIEFWDLIKMDVEGSEREIIMSLDKARAKQLSVEFHAHCAYGLETIYMLVEKLESLGYTAAQHTIERRHGLGFNAWDSLFVLANKVEFEYKDYRK